MGDMYLTLFLVVLSIVMVIFLTSRVKLNSFIALFLASLFLALLTLPIEKIVSYLQEGFGKTMAYIGFLVIFGAIIGVALDKSKGILSITDFVFKKAGKKHSAFALGMTGFIVGIPIFCDTGYIILSGLTRSISARTKIPLPFLAIVLAASLFSVHCLVPTHPGVLAGAKMMEVNIGHLILLGILFAIPGFAGAYLWGKYSLSKLKDKFFNEGLELEEMIGVSDLPNPIKAVLPVIAPVVLILVASILKLSGVSEDVLFVKVFLLLGDPVFALLTGAVLALGLISKKSVSDFNKIFDEAIVKAGPILIITAAGGMFGLVISSTGIGKEMGEILSGSGLGLVVPFIIAAFLKTAQGSSTVAAITAASFIGPVLPSLGLGTEAGSLFAILAIGAGSMVFSHANDSFFWVVTKFSRLEVNTTFKSFSPATFIMGMTTFILLWAVYFFMTF